MGITREIVEQVARLAGLALSEVECEEQTRDLSRMVDYMDRLADVSLESGADSTDADARAPSMRDDEARPGLPQEAALAAAPRRAGAYFQVPLVVDRAQADAPPPQTTPPGSGA